MEELGYYVRSNILYQDNQNTIKMEKIANHQQLKIQGMFIYNLFLKDCVDKGEIEIQYFPTHEMLAVYFTNPLQGALFRKYWNVIMGQAHINTLRKEPKDATDIKAEPFEIKERVGKSVISNDRSYRDAVLSGKEGVMLKCALDFELTPSTQIKVRDSHEK